MRDLCLGDQAIIDLLDGRSTEAERAALEEHVDHCAACRALVAAITRARGDAGPGRASEAPPDLSAWAQSFGRDLDAKPE